MEASGWGDTIISLLVLALVLLYVSKRLAEALFKERLKK